MTHDEEKLLREQMHKLLDIVLDTNGLERRTAATTGDRPTMFFEYQGHVNRLGIDINPNGWEPGSTPMHLMDQWLERPFTEKEMQYVEDTCKAALGGIVPQVEEVKREIQLKQLEIAKADMELAKLEQKLARLEKKGEPR